nr:permease [Paenibacillus sabuli]
MSRLLLRLAPSLLTLSCLGMVIVIWFDLPLRIPAIDETALHSFKIIFLSLILEAFPFILLGVLVSSLLQVFVSDRMIQRLTPRQPVLGVLFGSLLGVIFPLCECGMIPVVRRLIRKGMPAYIGIVFILAGPIVNPVVYSSTFMAFRNTPALAYSRMGLALAVTITIGLLLYRYMRRNPLREHLPQSAMAQVVGPGHDADHSHAHPANRAQGRFTAILGHASDEFFEMGKYLIFGALLTALIQTSLPREALSGIGEYAWLSPIFMMGFAFLLSICSTSDAFVAASFAGSFNSDALLAFLVFGPMIDLKNTLMLLAVFRTRIVLTLIVLCFVLVLIGSYMFHVAVFT